MAKKSRNLAYVENIPDLRIRVDTDGISIHGLTVAQLGEVAKRIPVQIITVDANQFFFNWFKYKTVVFYSNVEPKKVEE